MQPEPPTFIAFRQWLSEHGAYIHPDIAFETTDLGVSVISRSNLPADSRIVSCPESLIITPTTAMKALQCLSSDLIAFSDKGSICTYLVLHQCILSDSNQAGSDPHRSHFIHEPYLATLPKEFSTPLYFTDEEFELLVGTNLHHATKTRRAEWLEEWQKCYEWVHSVLPRWSELFTWDKFLWAETVISTRAFPSSLLSIPPSLSDPNAGPILVPLVDSLNHARGTPVSWAVENNTTAKHCLSLINHKFIPEGAEVFNNYGIKSNAELLLGYGFVLVENPEDDILLKLPGSERRFSIGRMAKGETAELCQELGRLLLEQFEFDDDEPLPVEAALQLEVAQVLPEMIKSLKAKLPDIDDQAVTSGRIRKEVVKNISEYIKGQREILDALTVFAEAQLEELGNDG